MVEKPFGGNMSTIKNNEITFQKDLGRKKSDGGLKNLWIELPGYCNLACEYCYASAGSPDRPAELLTWDNYDAILEQAKDMGVEDIGIPGAGEPFDDRIIDLTWQVLGKCRDLGMYTTLFTTAEFITEDVADRLGDMPLELMVKCNSLDPAKQDLFVSNMRTGRLRQGYGEKRNRALELLIKKGFNDQAKVEEQCRKFTELYGVDAKNIRSRLAIVTSIMTSKGNGPSNYDEMLSIQDYARKNNIMFDVDSVLKTGRGATCDLCEEDQRLKEMLLQMKENDSAKHGIHGVKIGQSYYGTVCDRFSYHIYISQHGEIRPCIGATGVTLGNAKTDTLEEAWNSVEMKIIRTRQYKGKCGECQNFNELDIELTEQAGTEKYKCNSCLGRRTENLSNSSLLEKGHVHTIGCWNYRQER
jgi:MoaA/NifB/PqqE/SkfB family radical SAM enzyme